MLENKVKVLEGKLYGWEYEYPFLYVDVYIETDERAQIAIPERAISFSNILKKIRYNFKDSNEKGKFVDYIWSQGNKNIRVKYTCSKNGDLKGVELSIL